jgi:hypothetical protein
MNRLRSWLRNVSGFHADIKYQSEAKVRYQDVLINDEAFRVGDTQFALTAKDKAQIKKVVTDPTTGQTYLDTAFAPFAI